jgi:heme-degrading monooxygenase HmoA
VSQYARPVLGPRIRHTVAFTLAHEEGSAEEREFLAAAALLAEIPGVEAFEVLREVSPKNGFRFGLSMEFADRAAYDGYNEHPAHVAFVQERWLPEVGDFLEVDYTAV